MQLIEQTKQTKYEENTTKNDHIINEADGLSHFYAKTGGIEIRVFSFD